jgi:hypothetical protein
MADDREERLKATLRENLRKRRAQAKGRAAGDAAGNAPAPDAPGGDGSAPAEG